MGTGERSEHRLVFDPTRGRPQMPVISKHTITWTGFLGAPGYSNFFTNASDDVAFHTALNTWKGTWAANLPDDVTLTLQAEVSQLDEATGVQTGAFSIGSDTVTQGANTGGYSAASGVVVHWLTGGFVAGRRVKGRTFMVPISGGAYQTNGTIDENALSFMRTSTNTFQNAVQGNMIVWARPFAGKPGKPARTGSSHDVTSWQIPDKVAILRSRRD